ncbi:MAG: hypothetical protein HOE90_06555 [Bacteriovoracaceae bacterium]|jgi:hypothetical protein|nr:hypothetical protein [Bacteriovoracaceae bacterium]
MDHGTLTFTLEKTAIDSFDLYQKYLGEKHFLAQIGSAFDSLNPPGIIWSEIPYEKVENLRYSNEQISNMAPCTEDTDSIVGVTASIQMSFSIGGRVHFSIIADNHPQLGTCILMDNTGSFSFISPTKELTISFTHSDGDVDESSIFVFEGEGGAFYNLLFLN